MRNKFPTKEEIPFPKIEQPITPKNEEKIQFNETDYDVEDLPIKDCISALKEALSGAGFNSSVRAKLWSILDSLDYDEKSHNELNGRLANAEGYDLEVASELHNSGEPSTVINNVDELYFIMTGESMSFSLRLEFEELYYEDAGWSDGY